MRVAFGALLLLGTTGTAIAGTVHVPGDHPTIQAAVDAAAEGDVVVVGPGVHMESVVAAKSNITIVGRGATWSGGNGEGAAPCLNLTGDGNSVIGFRFTNGTDQVVLTGADNTVSGCTSTGAGGSFAIVVGAGAMVEKCRVVGAGDDAVHVEGESALVSKVHVTRCDGIGIVVVGDDAEVVKCHVTDAEGGGISLSGVAGVAAKNHLRACGSFGVSAELEGGTLSKNFAKFCGDEEGAGFVVVGSDVTLEKNSALRCESDGFRVEGEGHALLKNKAIHCADDGFDIDGGIGISLHGCTAIQNGGCGIENGGEETDVNRSRFIRNDLDVALDGGLKSSYGTFDGNVYATGSVDTVLGF